MKPMLQYLHSLWFNTMFLYLPSFTSSLCADMRSLVSATRYLFEAIQLKYFSSPNCVLKVLYVHSFLEIFRAAYQDW